MYPFLRLALALAAARRMGSLPLLGTHVSRHLLLPWDLDPWAELNNGRTLTLHDLVRLPLALRTGITAALRARGWGMTVAGAAVRYRRRMVAFQRFEMRARLLGWDDRFLYLDQGMWRGGDCANHALVRSAVVGPGRSGIVPPARLIAAMGRPAESPPLPAWVRAWAAAEAVRPWPPEPGPPEPGPPEPGPPRASGRGGGGAAGGGPA